MKNIVGIGIFIVIILAVYFAYKQMTAPNEKIGAGCIKVDREKFPVEWQDENIPGGDIQKMREKYFPKGNQDTANEISGFFKGLNIYPSASAAKFYKNELKTFIKTNKALPYWSMAIGELACE